MIKTLIISAALVLTPIGGCDPGGGYTAPATYHVISKFRSGDKLYVKVESSSDKVSSQAVDRLTYGDCQVGDEWLKWLGICA